MAITREVLGEIASILEYLEDRGELNSAQDGSGWPVPIQRIRYTGLKELTILDVVAKGRVIRITATDVGAHDHELDGEGYCDICHYHEEPGVVSSQSFGEV